MSGPVPAGGVRCAPRRPPDGVEPASDAPEATRAGGRRHDGGPCGPRLPGAIPPGRVARRGSSPPRRHPGARELDPTPGLGWERTYLARRDEEIVGVLGAWDTGAFHATRVVSYSAAATIARGIHATARTVLREGAPLPEPGEAFRSLTITNLAVRGGDPRVLRALLSAVNNDHVSQGFHLCIWARPPARTGAGTRGWLRQRFSSSLYALTRTGGLEPPKDRSRTSTSTCRSSESLHGLAPITREDPAHPNRRRPGFLGWQCAPGRARFRRHRPGGQPGRRDRIAPARGPTDLAHPGPAAGA